MGCISPAAESNRAETDNGRARSSEGAGGSGGSQAPPGFWRGGVQVPETGRGSSPAKYSAKSQREVTKVRPAARAPGPHALPSPHRPLGDAGRDPSLPPRPQMGEAPEAVEEHSIRYRLLTDRAAACAAQGRYFEAERALQAALAVARDGFGPEDPHVAAAMANLGDLYKLAGRFEDADRLMLQSQALLTDIYGPSHPFVAWVRHSLATTRVRAGDFAGAVRLYEEALALQSRALGADHAETAQTLFALAAARFRAGAHDAARADFRRSLDVIEAQQMEKWPIGLQALENMARMHVRMGGPGDLDAAEGMGDRILRTLEGRFDLHVHAAACQALAGAALALAGAGRAEAAAEWLRRGMEATREHLGPRDAATRQLEACAVRVFGKHPEGEVRERGAELARQLVAPLERECEGARREADRWAGSSNLRQFGLRVAAARACARLAAALTAEARARAAAGDGARAMASARRAEGLLADAVEYSRVEDGVRAAVGDVRSRVGGEEGSEERERETRAALRMVTWSGEVVGGAVALRARLLDGWEAALRLQLAGPGAGPGQAEREGAEGRLRELLRLKEEERRRREMGPGAAA